MNGFQDILFAVLEFVSAYVLNYITLYEGYVVGCYEISWLNLHAFIVFSTYLFIAMFHMVVMLSQLVLLKLWNQSQWSCS
tara:strand:+ start:1133 stop:1372 length:240 start_codon:yes stop_codon:yes gene_type:complete